MKIKSQLKSLLPSFYLLLALTAIFGFSVYEVIKLKTPEPVREMANVVEIIDGDTIDVSIEGKIERVRYIGIDTPELGQAENTFDCFSNEATTKNSELVLDKNVLLVGDVSDRDSYGRILRYVYVDGVFVNFELVRNGYAKAIGISPDLAHYFELKDAEKLAKSENLGLWAVCR